MKKPKRQVPVIMKRRYPPQVMDALRKQAQSEDYRRERMQEMDSEATQHLTDNTLNWGRDAEETH